MPMYEGLILHIISAIISGSLQGHFIIEYNIYGYTVGKIVHPAIVVEILCPVFVLQQGQYFGRDAAGQVEAASRHQL